MFTARESQKSRKSAQLILLPTVSIADYGVFRSPSIRNPNPRGHSIPGARIGVAMIMGSKVSNKTVCAITSAVLTATLGCSSGTFTPSTNPPVTPAAITVTISGSAQTRLGQQTQFSASVANSSNQAVSWQVNGITGGSTTNGTISSAGLYSAPAALPGGNVVTIGAIALASSTATSTYSEAIWNPVPVMTSEAATQSVAAGPYLLDVHGSSFVSGAQIQVAGTPITTSVISSTELQATYAAPIGATTASVSVLNPNPGSAVSAAANVQLTITKVSVAAAARLLDQATFGPTLTDIQHVQSIGLDAYVTEQFNTAATVLPDLPNPLVGVCAPSNPKPCEQSEVWSAFMTGPDQLRQRVALAFSEMFVVSTNSISPYAVIPFHNLLTKDAFGNFSTMMKDVTLSTAMGGYLNMLNSAKPATVAGVVQIANENYARENMQLFTIGLNQLNQDGTPVLDGSGNMIPTYTQDQVQAFARAYTGWTYAGNGGKFPYNTPNFDSPMTAVEAQHDTAAKVLLNGTTLPAGQTSAQDLDGALANLFNSPNVAPFVCRQLIQHLVASNPSAAYVGRVSAVFNNNGSNVRGDLRAVIRAILEDTEARAGDTDTTQDGGHLREPILYLTGVMRGLGYVNTDTTGYYGTLSNYSNALGQAPYAANSVFNFFPPNYVIPGSVNAPEFDLENTASATLRLTQANQLVYGQISGWKVDLSATSALGLMASNPGNLVDSLGTMFMHGQMPANMRTAIVNHITTLTDPAQRVRVATYLVISSSQYKIEH